MGPRLRILFLTHYFHPEGNAPATRVAELSRRWVAAGHDVTVITGAPNVPDGVVYAGYRNRWNLPNPQILERWRNQGARTYVTADSGALSVSFPGGKPQIREFRCEHRKYWRRRSCPP